MEKEMKGNSCTWGHLERRTPDRSQWRALCAFSVSKHEDNKVILQDRETSDRRRNPTSTTENQIWDRKINP